MNHPAKSYSILFACLHDEQSPSVPAWAHHSIFRCVEYRDVSCKLLPLPILHDFAVIWDVDHDERIIRVVEHMYMTGLLAPVQFIGEHKGTLTVIIAARAWYDMDESAESYAQRVQAIVGEAVQDSWPVVLGRFDRSDREIQSAHQTELREIIGIDARTEHTFLLNLDGMWDLGSKLWAPTR